MKLFSRKRKAKSKAMNPFLKGMASLGQGMSSIGEGMAFMFDFTGSARKAQALKDKYQTPSNAASLKADWEVVGKDLQATMDKFEAELTPEQKVRLAEIKQRSAKSNTTK